MVDHTAVIKQADMTYEMQQAAIACATRALAKYSSENDIAAYIKQEFDQKFHPTWHCIVGSNFGSYVTHKNDTFIYFCMGPVAILLFKSVEDESMIIKNLEVCCIYMSVVPSISFLGIILIQAIYRKISWWWMVPGCVLFCISIAVMVYFLIWDEERDNQPADSSPV